MISGHHINWSIDSLQIATKQLATCSTFFCEGTYGCLLCLLRSAPIWWIWDMRYGRVLVLRCVSRLLSIKQNSHLQPCNLQVCGHVTWDSLAKIGNVVKFTQTANHPILADISSFSSESPSVYDVPTAQPSACELVAGMQCQKVTKPGWSPPVQKFDWTPGCVHSRVVIANAWAKSIRVFE